ncbi:MAG: type VII toxin-antitoxin system HepT family RNase toxin [Betaproteobacteria bacterium]
MADHAVTSGRPDAEILRRHLDSLRESLAFLRGHAGATAGQLAADVGRRWIVEHGLQLCAQNVLDISTHIAAASGLLVTDYRSGIDKIAQLAVIPRELAERLKRMAGLRNVLVHLYLEVDLNILARVLNQDLGDLDLFIEHVERYRLQLER